MAVIDVYNEFSRYLSGLKLPLKSAILNFKEKQDLFIKKYSIFNNLLYHLHSSHLHHNPHTYNGETTFNNYNDPLFYEKNKNTCFETKIYPETKDGFYSPLELLLREVSSEIDIDNNKLIYLKDFIFDINDISVPKILISTQRIEYQKNNNLIPKFTWNQYLNTVSPHLY